MTGKEVLAYTPLEGINTSFAEYVRKKKTFLSAHMSGNGLPDYAYCMDYEYRKKLDAIPGLYKNLKRLLIPNMQKNYQEYNMKGVKASPAQFSEIYQMGCDCAKTLGIGIPNIVVVQYAEHQDFNAFSYCIDDQEPLIIITSLMVQRFSPGELKTIIGHECGHSHNNHAIYSTAANILSTYGIAGLVSLPGLSQLAGLLSSSVQVLLQMWARAAEVTADRAAMICCNNLEDVYSADKKSVFGATNVSATTSDNLNIDELKKQLDVINASPYRFNELLDEHPISVRRIFADMEFAKCETLYSWRPDLKQPGLKLNSREETDEICKKIIGVMKTKEDRK